MGSRRCTDGHVRVFSPRWIKSSIRGSIHLQRGGGGECISSFIKGGPILTRRPVRLRTSPSVLYALSCLLKHEQSVFWWGDVREAIKKDLWCLPHVSEDDYFSRKMRWLEPANDVCLPEVRFLDCSRRRKQSPINAGGREQPALGKSRLVVWLAMPSCLIYSPRRTSYWKNWCRSKSWNATEKCD